MDEDIPKLDELIGEERKQIKAALEKLDQDGLADVMVEAVERLNALKAKLQGIEEESDKLTYRAGRLEEMFDRLMSKPAEDADGLTPVDVLEEVRRFPLDGALERLGKLQESVESVLADQTRYHRSIAERLEKLERDVAESAKAPPPPAPQPKPVPAKSEPDVSDKITTVLSVVVIAASVFLMGFIVWLLTR